MYVKVPCSCGTRYAFDVTPIAGRMPVSVHCPWCGVEGTALANDIIRSTLERFGPKARPATVSIRDPLLDIKVQCPCGVRYIFEVRPVDGRMPVPVFCPTCDEEGTARADELIRRALERETDVKAPSGIALPRSIVNVFSPVVRGHAPVSSPPPSLKPPEAAPGAEAPVSGDVVPAVIMTPVQLEATAHRSAAKPVTPVPARKPAEAVRMCSKHPQQPSTDFCLYCEKPICPQCMRHFGYFCSPRCRHGAEERGLEIPICPQQESAIKAVFWKLAKRVAIAAAVGFAGLGALWAWYEFIGSRPQTLMSVQLPGGASQEMARFVGPDKMLVISGPQMSFHDLKLGQILWTASLKPDENTFKPSQKHGTEIEEAGRRLPLYRLTDTEVWMLLPGEVVRFDLPTGARKRVVLIEGQVLSSALDDTGMLIVFRSVMGQTLALRIIFSNGEIRTVALAQPKPEAVVERTVANPPAADRASPNQESNSKTASRFRDAPATEYILAGENVAELGVKLIKPNRLTDQPAKAADEETSNNRKRTGSDGTVTVDESTYGVTLRRLWGREVAEWSGEVVGRPQLFPARTVDALVAGKSLILLDKHNQKLAEGKLAFPIDDRYAGDSLAAGSAPLIERDGVLYFFDQGGLTAFELSAGKQRWRLTRAGIFKLTFDAQGMLYVNTTSASPAARQSSEPIRVADGAQPAVLKVDAKTGKVLWKIEGAGQECYLSGKYVYVTCGQNGTGPASALPGGGAHYRICRINPGNGKVIWEYDLRAAPRFVDFTENRFLVCYEDEVEVMKYLSF